ncbi:hypothetical protein [Amycolatopsis sp. EV170708-02-1]|uniref:hypothetical protein n=1 Tax=Amycolatopsis sp. EV170708-02-1 TaxID=2919322 RepID=UPI001F0C4B8F|nr:hypothetical protein [Amycolatopsis sp. EV170708-02-1]UMP03552.1 hypothetical protein MJQ72_01300 [Amycolatopsis sp. EV170708-02-1]
MSPKSEEPPYLLAAQAGSVVRHLYGRLRAGEQASPADLCRTIGALQQLADDLTAVLPGLQAQLEESLLAGRIGAGDTAGEAWDKVADVGYALAQARTGGLLLAAELRVSRRTLGELASS